VNGATFVESVQRSGLEHASATAFFIRDRAYSYGELLARVALIRERLETELPASANVGIVTFDDIDTYAGIVATWFAGKTMVPVSSSHPADRTLSVLDQADIQVCLCSGDIPRGLEGASRTRFIRIADDAPAVVPRPPHIPSGSDTAYILFTSGTTGKPKGVPISHGALDSFLRAFFAFDFGFTAADRFLQMFDPTFDFSIMSYCVPLSIGASVYTVPNEGIKYAQIYRMLEEHRLTCAPMVPSILAHLRPYFGEIDLPDVRASVFCGEALYDDLVTEWLRCTPNSRLINFYGPTEATVFCTAYECERSSPRKTLNGIVCIGRPMQGTQITIVDEDRRPVPQGTLGELCLAGPQLTAGYFNNPPANDAAFFVLDGTRYYRSGDLCQTDPDGDLYYCGRVDQQIKIQGYRVELSEIEHHVRQLTGIKHVAAATSQDDGGNTIIHLFLEQFAGSIPDLLASLRTKVPAYMIPARVASLPALPLNNNGKIDRPALARLAARPPEQ